MKKHSDAVVIVGPGIGIPRTEKPTKEELEENYTAKTLRREPEKFWPFFRKYIFTDPNTSEATQGMRSIKEMSKLGLISTIVTQNTDGLFYELGLEDVIHLHGHTYRYSAGKKTYDAYDLVNQNEEVPVNEDGKPYRPKVLLHGENYKQDDFDNFKTALINTHTLIVVGLDYSEETIVNLIADYVEIKNTANALAEDYEKKAVVAIGPSPYDLNKEIGYFD